MKSTTVRLIATFAVLDLVFNPLVTLAYLQMLNVPELGNPFMVFAGLWLLKIGAAAVFLFTQLRPHERCVAGRSIADATLLAADRCLQRLPWRFGIFYGVTWSATYGLGYLCLKSFYPEYDLSPRCLYAVALVALAVWCGGFSFAFPIASILSANSAGRWSVEARTRGLDLERPAAPLQLRIGAIAITLGLGPTIWMMALGYMNQIDAQQASGGTLGRLAAMQLSAWVGDGQAGTPPDPGDEQVIAQLLSVDDGTPVPLTTGAGGAAISAASLAALRSSWNGEATGVLEHGSEDRVIAYSRVDERRVALVVVDLSRTPRTFMISAGAFAAVVALWAPLCAAALGRSISGPLERLTSSAREIVEEGKHSQMGALPVAQNDEVGLLSEHFNDLIDMMRDLSRAADAIADGDLRTTISRRGELPDAFRRMLDGLREMVGQIRGTSIRLASAAAEIFAAAQEQEAAATSQSSAMEEINRTMDSLSQSAAHVSEAVQGVLGNAEQTLANTAEMVGKIGQLSSHAGRISEILEVIREIADRSDLLALNGSLEASRAGEGGHGFALVASEMRRLGERVTASVQDIKKLVVDIRESGSSTVMATEESRRLAEGTTQAARQITFVSQQQRSGTEQVSQSIKSISEVVSQAVSATSQTRVAAEDLKAQADRLEELARGFELAEAAA